MKFWRLAFGSAFRSTTLHLLAVSAGNRLRLANAEILYVSLNVAKVVAGGFMLMGRLAVEARLVGVGVMLGRHFISSLFILSLLSIYVVIWAIDGVGRIF